MTIILDRAIYLNAVPSGGGEGGTSDYEQLSNLPQINGETIIGNLSSEDLGLASKTELDSKMIRYIIKLVKNGDTYSIQTYDGTPLDFATLSTQIKNTSNYVVMVYGNSKLRPQYVSTSEMMFIGLDRSQDTKVLRVIFTPTRCSYETFELVENSDLTNYVKNTDYPSSGSAGVIRTSLAYSTQVSASGYLQATTKTAEQYPDTNNTAFISKGTLENLMETWQFTLATGEVIEKKVLCHD